MCYIKRHTKTMIGENMRKKLIAGNWKMNMLQADGTALACEIVQKCRGDLPFDVLVCPPYTLLSQVVEAAQGSKMMVGAQNVTNTAKLFGAYTGEISAIMVKDMGATHTLVGHSERRQMYGETDAIVLEKASNAIRDGLTAVICIGETLQERDSGRALDVVTAQINGSVPKIATDKNCVIAYEPVWAIGTGKVPTNEDVAEVHQAIRMELTKLLGATLADKMRILYGGSVKPSNAAELLGIQNVDGALIGGASLKSEDFWAIAETQL